MMRKAAVQGASRRVAGFTLLEVLIATSILGIMMVLLFGSMRICIRSWEAGEAHMQKVSRMTVIQNFFRSHLRSALTFPDSKNPGDFEEQEPFFREKSTSCNSSLCCRPVPGEAARTCFRCSGMPTVKRACVSPCSLSRHRRMTAMQRSKTSPFWKTSGISRLPTGGQKKKVISRSGTMNGWTCRLCRK